MMTQGVGKANCFYEGAVDSAGGQGKHIFRCTDMGALAKDNKVVLAFQFQINNEGKVFTKTTETTADSNVVKIISKKVDCTLKISTWASATASTVEWYSSKFTTPVDGWGQASKMYKW